MCVCMYHQFIQIDQLPKIINITYLLMREDFSINLHKVLSEVSLIYDPLKF